MTKNEFHSKILCLSVETRTEITKKLQTAMNAINSAECSLADTPLYHLKFLEINDGPTLWCNIYEMKKIFDPTEIFVLEINYDSLTEFIN